MHYLEELKGFVEGQGEVARSRNRVIDLCGRNPFSDQFR